MKEIDKQKIAHDSLLREMHNIDHITEMHAQVVIILLGALIAFVSLNIKSLTLTCITSCFGILISIEWLIKVVRHRYIFRTAHDKLTRLQKEIGINTIRPLPKLHKTFFSLDGFTILIWLAIIFLLFWTGLLIFSVLSL